MYICTYFFMSLSFSLSLFLSLSLSSQIDITWFPFDDQECRFQFSSWTLPIDRLNLTLPEAEVIRQQYVENGVRSRQGEEHSIPTQPTNR